MTPRLGLGGAGGPERGAIGGLWGLAFGMVVFVGGTLLIVNAWAVIDAKMGTTAAAREAARTLVESEGDLGDAGAAGRAAFENQVGSSDRLSGPVIEIGGGEFVRCARVEVTYTYTTPLVSFPFFSGFGGGIDVTSTHSEIVDPFRAGLGEESRC